MHMQHYAESRQVTLVTQRQLTLLRWLFAEVMMSIDAYDPKQLKLLLILWNFVALTLKLHNLTGIPLQRIYRTRSNQNIGIIVWMGITKQNWVEERLFRHHEDAFPQQQAKVERSLEVLKSHTNHFLSINVKANMLGIY